MKATDTVLTLLTPNTPSGIRLGKPHTVAALTLIPLFHEGATVDYLTYSEAIASNLATITEVDEAGTVPNLLLRNAAARPILLVEGEVVVGLKQNRVLNTTILAAPMSSTMIPVSCVEQGRWHNAVGAARRSEIHLAPKARAKKNFAVAGSVRMTGSYAANQGEVWAEVADRLERHQIESPTASYDDLAAQSGDRIKHLLDQMRPQPGQCGVLALIAGAPACLDLFDRPSTLEQMWAGLIGSYWVDALVDQAPAADPLKRANGWLAAIARTDATEHDGVGVGRHVALTSPSVVASALVADDVPVHIGAFALDGAATAGPTFVPPHRRPRRARGQA